MQSSSHMARYGARLVTNGYAILPIAPGTKKPGRFQRGAWVDYPEWNRHASRPTTEVEVATWSAWPDCGVGLVGGAVAAIDIDIAEDAQLSLKIEKLARDRLGDTPALRIGRAPKRLLVYRAAEPFRGIKRHPLEVLCLGQQFLAYATHPDTGAPYAWPEEGLADLDISDLPAITADEALAFLEVAQAMLPEGLVQRGLVTTSSPQPHPRRGSPGPSTRPPRLQARSRRSSARRRLPASASQVRTSVGPGRPANGVCGVWCCTTPISVQRQAGSTPS